MGEGVSKTRKIADVVFGQPQRQEFSENMKVLPASSISFFYAFCQWSRQNSAHKSIRILITFFIFFSLSVTATILVTKAITK